MVQNLGIVVRAMKKAVENAHLYPSGHHERLRRKIAACYGFSEEEGPNIHNVYVGNGSDEIIRTITTTFLNRGEEVILSDVSYPDYEDATRQDVGRVVKVPIGPNYSVDLEAMVEAVTEKTKLIFVCNPNNPTGTALTHEQAEAFLDRLPRHLVVVFDEAYFEFADHATFPRLLDRIKRGDNVIILRTFSKAYALAGIRVGYALAHKTFVESMYRLHMPFFNVNVAALVGADAALDNQKFLRHSVQLAQTGKRDFYREFERLGLPFVPSQTNFVLMLLGDRAQPVFQKLLQGGEARTSIIVRPTKSFGLEEGLRVSIGTPAQNRSFIAQLEAALAVTR